MKNGGKAINSDHRIAVAFWQHPAPTRKQVALVNSQTKLKANTTNAGFEPLSQPDKLSQQIQIKPCNEYAFCTYKAKTVPMTEQQATLI